MCIIVIKPEGIKLPDLSLFEICSGNNKDGIGYMYRTKEDVTIRKGFFNVSDFYNSVKKLGDTEIIIHFRYATHGKTTSGNCHPFPLSNDVKDLKHTHIGCEIGICHNGIISDIPASKDLSDTMMFLKTVSDKDIKQLPGALGTTNGKFAIMTRYKTYMIGEYIYDQKTGCYFSNNSFEVKDYFKPSRFYDLSFELAGVPGIGDIIDPLCETCKFDYDDKYGLNAMVCCKCDGVTKYISDDNDGDDLEYEYLYDECEGELEIEDYYLKGRLLANTTGGATYDYR